MELAELGAGYVMFFKMVIFFGAIMIGFSVIGVLKAVSNFKGTSCISESEANTISSNSLTLLFNGYIAIGFPVCTEDWITVHSVANYGIFYTDDDELTWMLIAMIAYWFVLAICNHYIKANNKDIDRLSDTPSDWTMMVRGLPPDEPAGDIKANFEMYGTMNKMPCVVKKVTLAYECDQYEEKEAKVGAAKRRMKKLQMAEMDSAIRRKVERDSAQKKDKKDEDKKQVDLSKVKPDIKDFSADFQKKFIDMNEEIRAVENI